MADQSIPVGPFTVIDVVGSRSVVSAGEMAWIRASMELRSKKLAERCMTVTEPAHQEKSPRYAGEFVLALNATEMEQLHRVPGVVIEPGDTNG